MDLYHLSLLDPGDWLLDDSIITLFKKYIALGMQENSLEYHLNVWHSWVKISKSIGLKQKLCKYKLGFIVLSEELESIEAECMVKNKPWNTSLFWQHLEAQSDTYFSEILTDLYFDKYPHVEKELYLKKELKLMGKHIYYMFLYDQDSYKKIKPEIFCEFINSLREVLFSNVNDIELNFRIFLKNHSLVKLINKYNNHAFQVRSFNLSSPPRFLCRDKICAYLIICT
jgi:hypothetical protein